METKDQPNILIIHADQHRFDCIGAYGNRDVLTPNIDKLAADGVIYQNSFCSFPVCTPSRYSLLSGLYVHQHMGWTNHCTLPYGLDTFPRILRLAGYHTKAVGKMHFTPTYLDVGFEEMELAEQDGPGRYDDDYHRFLMENGLADHIDLMDQVMEYRQQAPDEYWHRFGTIESDLDEAHYSTTWIGDRTVETLRQWNRGGNLLMVGFTKPHHPFDPPAPWSRMYDANSLTLLPGWTKECLPLDLQMHRGYFHNSTLTEDRLKKIMAYYYATISQIDYHVGRMVEVLKQQGIYDNTMIIYTSDHGDYMGYHHMVLKGGYMYDPLMKVPLIIKYPGLQYAGTTCKAMVSNLDLASTILRQAGCHVGKFMQGIDLAENKAGRDLIFAESGMGTEYMVRSAEYKLLLCRDREESQFFDLRKDPFECHNLFQHLDYQKLIAEYIKALAEWLLFDTTTPVYLDEEAPLIVSTNVPALKDNHRGKSIQYFRQHMKDANNVLLRDMDRS